MNLRNTIHTKGFTIVELLIVVVVIAILAAITIVSYNGITTKAKDSSAKAAASNVQKKAELFFAIKGGYPDDIEQFAEAGQAFELPASAFTTNDDNPDASNGEKVVRWSSCGTRSGVAPNRISSAATITYYEYAKSGGADVTTITLGTCIFS